MVTIPVTVPDELAKQLYPVQARLPEIIELGLQHLDSAPEPDAEERTLAALAALEARGMIRLPAFPPTEQPYVRRTPIQAEGPSASDLIIAERDARGL